MHPVAVTCVKWAVGLFVVGALAMAFGTEVFFRIADYAGANAEAGVRLMDLLITLVRWTTMPLGASLVGAAVVIQTLAPHVREVEDGERERD